MHPTLPYILTCSDDMLIKLWDWDKVSGRMAKWVGSHGGIPSALWRLALPQFAAAWTSHFECNLGT